MTAVIGKTKEKALEEADVENVEGLAVVPIRLIGEQSDLKLLMCRAEFEAIGDKMHWFAEEH